MATQATVVIGDLHGAAFQLAGFPPPAPSQLGGLERVREASGVPALHLRLKVSVYLHGRLCGSG